jgi:tRNA-Thr(GGU) m(6)t(6)A37 methyltransferase TsaA
MTPKPETIVFIGEVRSCLSDVKMCPKKPEEGAPEGLIRIKPEFSKALQGMGPGKELYIFTWLHLANRNTQLVHPRGNPHNPKTGVFCTRSPDRPNPIGLHRVRVLEMDNLALRISAIEVVDRTPVIDIKPAAMA